ncbi:ECF transporter S component [Erysipelotrichaceae bacterium OttesenSCG-928-M19]|nr:ECF transporter S component [Erysipelotrichaceae bacterium OttesenSCG-928-M19]
MNKTRKMAFSAMIIAIILLMAAVPFLGYIQVGVMAITIIHIPTIIGSISFNERSLALISGTTFGVSSWLVAMFRPSSIADIVFQNPLVSVLPRILFALIAFYLFKKLVEVINNKTFALALTSAIATFLHTVMVLGMIFIFARHSFPEGFTQVLMAVFSINSVLEIIAAVIVVPPIVMVLNKTIKIS